MKCFLYENKGVIRQNALVISGLSCDRLRVRPVLSYFRTGGLKRDSCLGNAITTLIVSIGFPHVVENLWETFCLSARPPYLLPYEHLGSYQASSFAVR